MTVSLGLSAIAASAGGAAAVARTVASDRVVLRLRAVDRDGQSEPLQYGAIFKVVSGNPWPVTQLDGSSYRLAPGRYIVATIVPTMQDGSDVADTIAVRNVTLRHDMTVLLSAQGSVPATVSLNGVAVTDLTAGVALAGNASSGDQLISDGQTAIRPLYVKPYRARNLVFGYLATAPTLGSGSYYLAGSSANGIPQRPGGSFTSAGLATVTVGAAAGTLPPWPGNSVELGFTGPGGASDDMQKIPAGSAVTNYLSPGKWTLSAEQVIPNSSGGWLDYRSAGVTARHLYTETFFPAAFGPDLTAHGPCCDATVQLGNGRVEGGGGAAVSLPLWSQFTDPASLHYSGTDTAATAVATLSRPGRVLKRSRYQNLESALFKASASGPGWYTLAVTATRPKALLSARVRTVWRFRSLSGSGSQVEYPLSFATLQPHGLNLNNQASPEGTTAVTVREVMNYLAPGRLPRGDDWKSITVQVSFNDGATWHATPLLRSGARLKAVISDPDSGFVSLRVTAVNKAGESAQQTTYQAYGIA